MVDKKAMVKKSNGALQPWASRDDVREISERLAMMALPGGKKLSRDETLALAQASISHGLDPFNGEIWIIPGSGLKIGVKGLRKKAREQLKVGNFWTNFRLITSPEERAALKIPDKALAYECRLYDTETILSFADAVSKLTAAKIPWEDVREMMGDKPYASGVGVFKDGEASKMTPSQCAMKRAETHALVQRFDVPFSMKADADLENVIGGDWVVESDAEDDDRQEMTQAEADAYTLEQDKKALFPDD